MKSIGKRIAELTFATSSTALGSGPRVIRRGVIGLSTLVGMLLLATGIGTSAAAAASQGSTPLVGAASKGIAWKGCGEQLECAKVRVPLDWDRRRGSKIKLAVIRHLASRPEERIGSLFVNPGGPGQSGVSFVRDGGGELLDGWVQGRFDVVSWDVRGSNDVEPGRPGPVTTPVRCFEDEASRIRFWGDSSVPTTASESRRYRRKTAAFARRCGELSGSLLRHLTNADMARDLNYLRRLVGGRLNYYGLSWGSLLGQTYANMFPRRVRAMAIDGVVGPIAYMKGSEAALANNLSDGDRVFEEFQSLCQAAGPERCALAGDGEVAVRVEELLDRSRRGSIAAPSADPPGALTYGEVLFQISSELGLGEPSGWADLAEQLDQAAAGDGSAMATAARRGFQAFPGSPMGDGLTAIWCADSPARRSSRAWPQVIGRLTDVSFARGPVMGWLAWAPCASWPTRSADRYTGPWDASTQNPILVMDNRFDPDTAFANAGRSSRRLGNAVLLKQQGYGHTTPSDPSACTEKVLGEYLVDLVAPEPGTPCPSDRQPFDPDFGEPLP